MTAPMAPEELAAIEERYHRIGAPDDAVLRLLAEVRRLQAERDARDLDIELMRQRHADELRATDEHAAKVEDLLDRSGTITWAERAAAPPVGQTVERAIFDLVEAAYTLSTVDHAHGDIATAEANRNKARDALLRAITARDAEVARAAAEREREACATEMDSLAAEWQQKWQQLAEQGFPPQMAASDGAARIRSRAPAPAGECQHSWMGPAQTGPFYCGNCGAQKP